MTNMISLKNVNKFYVDKKGCQLPALKNINLDVEKGTITGVIGRSGAGKSTLIRCVNLLEKPNSGDVIINGENLTQLNKKSLQQARHKIGMIFQQFNLMATRTVFDNIAFPLKLLGESRQTIKDAVLPLLELTGLSDKADMYPQQLSGGQQQRVAIARALVCKPHVLLCDEPTSALDPETTQSILELLKTINQKFKLTILLITHEMEAIKAIADRVAVIDQGEIIEETDIISLFSHPKTTTTKQLTKQSIKENLPKALTKNIHPNPQTDDSHIISIRFLGNAASKPIINELATAFSIKINILQAHLEYIHNETLGTMIIALNGDEKNIAQAKQFLADCQLTTETIGYVKLDVLANG